MPNSFNPVRIPLASRLWVSLAWVLTLGVSGLGTDSGLDTHSGLDTDSGLVTGTGLGCGTGTGLCWIRVLVLG